MTATATQVLRPRGPQIERLTDNRAKIVIEPLERGNLAVAGEGARQRGGRTARGGHRERSVPFPPGEGERHRDRLELPAGDARMR